MDALCRYVVLLSLALGVSGGAGLVWAQPDCVLECPPYGVLEGEPTCHTGYVDEFNSGCGSYGAPVFSQAVPGVTVCGEGGAWEGYERDTDSYVITIPRAAILEWTVVAEYPVMAAVIGLNPDCNDQTMHAYDIVGACEPAVAVTECLPAGTYACWTGTTDWENTPCGAKYIALLHLYLCGVIPGDADCNGSFDFGDINPFVMAVVNTPLWQESYPDCPLGNVDISGDGNVGFEDINPFVELMLIDP